MRTEDSAVHPGTPDAVSQGRYRRSDDVAAARCSRASRWRTEPLLAKHPDPRPTYANDSMSHAGMNDDDIAFSDDEKDAKVTWSQARRFKMPFGKHRGEFLGDIVAGREGRNYLRYILSWSDLKDNTRQQIQCAIDHYEMLKSSIAVTND